MRAVIEKYPYLTILTLWAFVFLCHLGLLYPNIMEARNFITAREMLTDGNWILTTMDGLPRYEKPPLPTWLTAFSGKIFGLENIAALRLPSALITLALLFYMYSFSQRIVTHKFLQGEIEISKVIQNKTYALITTLVAGTSFYIIFAGRNGTWDIFAHVFMLMGIYFLYRFFNATIASYKYSLLAGIFMGLSFMSKGPVSHYALLIPFLIAYGSVYKFKNFRNKWLPLILMFVVTVILSSWWSYYIYLNDITDATRIAEKETTRWINYATKPFYYYWSFFVQSGIWTIPAFICLLYPYLKTKVFDLKAYRFTLLWTLAAVILLSLIPTKKSRYLLPVLIPLACTIGFYIEYLFRAFHSKISTWEKAPVYFNFGLIATIGIVFPLGIYLYFGNKLLNDYYLFYILSSIALFTVGLFIWYYLLKQKLPMVFYGTVAFIMFAISLGFPLANVLLDNPNYNSISALRGNKMPVVALDGLSPELVWDYGKAITRVTKEELQSGSIEQLGVLTYFNEGETRLEFLKDSYTVKWKETFDLNPLNSTKSGYKSRLKADYYILSKK